MNYIVFFIALLSISLLENGYAQMPAPAKMESSLKPSSTIQGNTHLTPSSKQTAPPKKTEAPFSPVELPTLAPQKSEYFHPGILVFYNGRWEGSDHLYNISNQIGVNISIIKPEEEVLNVNEQTFQKQVEAAFSQGGIIPQSVGGGDRPPLPVFDIQIMIYPIEKGYVACIEGRLFESVILDRFRLDPNMAFQAITWEKRNLVVSPNALLSEQLSKTIAAIASSFVERYQVYERYKKAN